MVKWTLQDHKRVYYSDECQAQIGGGKEFIKIREGEDRNDEKFRRQKEAHPLSIFIWVMISWNGVEWVEWL